MRKIQPVVKKYKMREEPSDFLFWQTKSVEERLEAMELLRKQFYGYDYETLSGFPKVYRITQQKQR